jgi:DnaK suppressor protein
MPSSGGNNEEDDVDSARASELLQTERTRVQDLIRQARASGQDNRAAADEPGDMTDSAEPLISEGTDDAVVAGLTERLAALDRAEERLASGTFGRSVRSGLPIPDERLEADPAAGLTIEEARGLG